MNWKQYARYQMDFKGKWANTSAVLMGLSFFLRVVYYFGLTNLSACGVGEILFHMALPLLLCGVYIALLSGAKLNAPGIYGMIGAALCVLMVLWGFSTGSVVRVILGLICYLFAGAVLVATAGGYLPGMLLASALFAVPVFVRFFFFDLGKIGIFDWFLEASVLIHLASLFCLTRSLKPVRSRAVK